MDHACASLRADGRPLRDERVRDTVLSAARALAERTGVAILQISADDSGIEVVLDGPEAAAVGFVAELRRSTNAWHAQKHGGELWPAPKGPARGDDLPS